MVFSETKTTSSSGRSPCDANHTQHETPPKVHHEKERLNLLKWIGIRREISNNFTTTDVIHPLHIIVINTVQIV